MDLNNSVSNTPTPTCNCSETFVKLVAFQNSGAASSAGRHNNSGPDINDIFGEFFNDFMGGGTRR
ncbi:MAG: hypothetical protein ACEY3C_01265, partial [Candidatus Tisiphia sp.]